MLAIQSVNNYMTRTFSFKTIVRPSPGCWSKDNYLPRELIKSRYMQCQDCQGCILYSLKCYLVCRFLLKFYEGQVFQLIWRVLIIQKEEIKINRFNWNFNRKATLLYLTNCVPLPSLYSIRIILAAVQNQKSCLKEERCKFLICGVMKKNEKNIYS